MRAIAARAPSLPFAVTERPTGRPTSVPRATAPRRVDDRVSVDERTRDENASMAATALPLPRVSEPGGIHAFLFDMDGTLCDTDPIHHEVFADLLMAHGKNGGVRIDDAFFREHIAGKTNEAIFPALFPELDAATHEKMWEEKEARLRARGGQTHAPAGAHRALRWGKEKRARRGGANAPRPTRAMLRAPGWQIRRRSRFWSSARSGARETVPTLTEGMWQLGHGPGAVRGVRGLANRMAAAVAAGAPPRGSRKPLARRAVRRGRVAVRRRLRGRQARGGARVIETCVTRGAREARLAHRY